MSYRIFDNLKLTDMPPMSETIDLMRNVINSSFSKKDFLSRPRIRIPVNGNNELVFSMCESANIFGYRHYPALETEKSEDPSHITVIYHKNTGKIKSVIFGETIPAWRTGAIGGLAVEELTSGHVNCLGVLGTGIQAITQVIAATSVRNFKLIKVFSPNPSHVSGFSEKISWFNDVPVICENNPESVVREADVLICATSSAVPVFKSNWLKKTVLINNIGPKLKSKHELPLSVYTTNSGMFTDALAQAKNIKNIVLTQKQLKQLKNLTSPNKINPVDFSGRKLFVSLGLPGSEVFLADKITEYLITSKHGIK